METKVDLVGGDALQAALMKAAFEGQKGGELESTETAKKGANKEKERGVSPLTGAPVPQGRQKGTPNKVTKTIRDAVMQAFDEVGGPAYLVELARGTQSDRAAFTSLLNKVLPTQINANVEGGIQVQLSWLGARSIGTVTAQQAEQITQVIDLEQESNGKYRIKEPATPAAGGDTTSAGQEGAKDA